ncbi:MAG: glycosyltransferase family 4 protein [Ornithinimicrobium sp.]
MSSGRSNPLHQALRAVHPPAAVRTIANTRLIASLVRQHSGRAGSKVVSVLLRRAPAGVRTVFAGQRCRPDVAALALAANGQMAMALELLATSAEGHTPASSHNLARPARLAASAVTLHDLPLAQRLWAPGRPAAAGGESVSSLPSWQRRLAALMDAERGDVSGAITRLRGDQNPRSTLLLRRLLGESEVLQAVELRARISGTGLDTVAAPTSTPASVDRVLHVVSSTVPEQQSGYTIRTHGIALAQCASGMDAQVVSRSGFPVDIGKLSAGRLRRVDGVAYHRLLPRGGLLPVGRARQQQGAAQLRALAERERPDVLHAHSKHENAQVALLVGASMGLPVVYELRGFLEETWRTTGGTSDSDFYRWTRQTETLCMAQADAVITLSSAMAEDIAGRGVDPDKITVVPNAVSQSFVTAAGQRSTKRVREMLGIPARATVFGTVSTLNDYEGLDTVIAAMKRLNDDRLRLLIVGTGPARARLEAMSRPLGDRVCFTGQVPHAQVLDYFQAMDVFVLPRRATPVTRLVPPIKPIEAMAAGVPVLASDLAPLTEIVQPGRFGAVAPAQDPSAWAEQIGRLGYAPQEVRDLGAQAAEFVRRERTWTQAANRYAKVYGETARR